MLFSSFLNKLFNCFQHALISSLREVFKQRFRHSLGYVPRADDTHELSVSFFLLNLILSLRVSFLRIASPLELTHQRRQPFPTMLIFTRCFCLPDFLEAPILGFPPSHVMLWNYFDCVHHLASLIIVMSHSVCFIGGPFFFALRLLSALSRLSTAAPLLALPNVFLS